MGVSVRRTLVSGTLLRIYVPSGFGAIGEGGREGRGRGEVGCGNLDTTVGDGGRLWDYVVSGRFSSRNPRREASGHGSGTEAL